MTAGGFCFVTWFAEDDFAHFRQLFPVRFPSTYAGWAECTRQIVEIDRAAGIEVQPVTVRADEFVAWCRAIGREIEGRALQDYTDRVGLAARCRQAGR